MMVVSNELTEWNTLEFCLTPMMWWLYNVSVYDDVDYYNSGDDDKDDDFDLKEWWWALERDLPAGVATSQTEVMMTEMNSEVLKYVQAGHGWHISSKKRKEKAQLKKARHLLSLTTNGRYDDGPWKARAQFDFRRRLVRMGNERCRFCWYFLSHLPKREFLQIYIPLWLWLFWYPSSDPASREALCDDWAGKTSLVELLMKDFGILQYLWGKVELFEWIAKGFLKWLSKF